MMDWYRKRNPSSQDQIAPPECRYDFAFWPKKMLQKIGSCSDCAKFIWICSVVWDPFHSSVAAVAQGILVEDVLSESSADALQVGHVVRQLLDGLDLLLQVMALDEVRQLQREKFVIHNTELRNKHFRIPSQHLRWLLWTRFVPCRMFAQWRHGRALSVKWSAHLIIVVLISDGVKVKQRLVDALLQGERSLHCLESAAPLIPLRLLQAQA